MCRVLYKHLPSRYADGLVEKGCVRIGTLYEYRDDERHGEGVLDKEEGFRNTTKKYDRYLLKEDTFDPFLKGVIKIEGDSRVVLDGTRVTKQESSPNCWIYCVSLSDDDEVGRNLSDRYDACVRIDDPKGFLIAMGKYLNYLANCLGWMNCQYIGRDVPVGNRVHPVMLKEAVFSHQKECRAIFHRAGCSPQPLIVEIPSLRKFVTRIR